MARTALTKIAPTDWTSNGTNLTDLSYTTMSTGSGNGKTFAHDNTDMIVLLNDTGGNATYTIIAEPVPSVTDLGGSITDPTVVVVTAKTHVFRPIAGIRQSDGDVYIDCDVAGKIAVLTMSTQG